MKPQYFTDLRDYFKYSGVRHLLAHDLPCAICWMLTPDVGGQAGLMRDYLEDLDNWRDRDPAVFDFLRDQYLAGNPDVRSTQDHPTSPVAQCRFHWPPFPQDREERPGYFHAAIEEAADSSFIFIDPDIGPAPPSLRPGKLGGAHITPAEIAHIQRHGFSVLVFHFLQRNPIRRADQVATTRQRLAQAAPAAVVRALRTEDLAFYFVLQPDHEPRVQPAINDIIADWQGPLLRTPP